MATNNLLRSPRLLLRKRTMVLAHNGLPLTGYLTVDEVSSWLNNNKEQFGDNFLTAEWEVVREAPVSLENQDKVMMKRLGKIANTCDYAVINSSFTINGICRTVRLSA